MYIIERERETDPKKEERRGKKQKDAGGKIRPAHAASGKPCWMLSYETAGSLVATHCRAVRECTRYLLCTHHHRDSILPSEGMTLPVRRASLVVLRAQAARGTGAPVINP
jgi:hypothetical protein